jgi:hypothetical protein
MTVNVGNERHRLSPLALLPLAIFAATGRIAYKHVLPFNWQSLERYIALVVHRLQAEGKS